MSDQSTVTTACAECGGGAKECSCGGSGGECRCGSAGKAPAHVYATGTVTARFPSLDVEKEFLQARGSGVADSTVPVQITGADKFEVLGQGQNLYLARQMCWIFQSQDIDMFVLQPRTQVELTDLVTCLAPTPGLVNYALVVGSVGPVAPPWMCNGVGLPIVHCEQVFSFTGKAFVESVVAEIKKKSELVARIEAYLKELPKNPPPDSLDVFLDKAAKNAFGVMTVLSDNTGQTDEHRAINYLTFKSMELYTNEVEMEVEGFRLNSVTARPDPLSRTRRIQDVILLYTNTTTQDVRRYFTRVDVTGQFPFLINPLARYFDRP